ncbi:MAG: hypothetical protein QW193_04445 [Nitrososphaerales archaeon]
MSQTTPQTITGPAAKKIIKKYRLLANLDVKRWYDNLARGSPITAEVRLRRVNHFCEVHGMTLTELAELAIRDIKTLTDLIEDHVAWMEREGYSPGYIKSTVIAIKSWLHHHDIEIKRRIKIANFDSTPTLENERVPEPHELAEVFNRASLRVAASIALIGKAGLRPESLGNYNATDGLMIKDLPDLVIHQGEAKWIQTPPLIIVRKTLSKAKHQYFTFITNLGAKKLLAYFNDRLARGEILVADSPVIAPDSIYKTYRGNNANKKFLPTSRICREIRETLRPRFQWRPYVFRAFFDTQMLIAESRGKIAHDFRVFFMGHKGSIEAKYTTNKGILPTSLLNEMREAFKRSEVFLDLEVKEEDSLLKQKEQIQNIIQQANPEQLGKVLKMLNNLGIGNPNPSKE